MVTGGGWLIAKGLLFRCVPYYILLTLFAAATVAIRYATVRRQGERGPDGLEKQIISYPSVYYRLLPILSRAYMFIHLGRTLVRSSPPLLKPTPHISYRLLPSTPWQAG